MSPNPYVLLDSRFVIVWMNEAYLRVTMRSREEILGREMFEAFPSPPESENGARLRASLVRVLRTGERDHIPLIHYDIRSPDGGVAERYWSATHTPLRDGEGKVAYILQHTVDVTELHLLRQATSDTRTGTLSTQVEGEVFRHARQVEDRSRILEEERDHLRGLFEQAPGFMAVLQGPDHVFTLANEAYLSLVGRRSILGLDLVSALPEIASQGFIDILDQVYSSGKPYVGRNVPVMLRSEESGLAEERILDFVYQPIRGRGGTVDGIFVQGHDLTDLKRAELALQESEARFRLVAESAPVMLWMSDERGGCVYLNRAQRDFWGVDVADPDGFDWSRTLHPDDAQSLWEPYREAMERHSGFDVEARFRRIDGEFRTLHTQAQPRFGPAGEFTGMIGVNVDVTETRLAEAALREETRLLEILNQTNVAVAAELDLERVVQKVTDAGVALTGASFGAFFYNTVSGSDDRYMLYSLSGASVDAFAHFPMPRITKLFEPTFRGERVVRSDDVTSDGSLPGPTMPAGHLPVRSYLAVPVRSRSGDVLGGLLFGHPEPGIFTERSERLSLGLAAQAAVAIDNARLFGAAEREIAQRSEAEQALQQLNARLEEEVAARTEELQRNEEALRQAQKMEALGRLTGGVAHDFNNLLQIIGGNLQMLAKDVAEDPRVAQRLQNALAGVARGATLAAQLLAFGRRQPLAPKVINPVRLVQRLDDMLRRALREGVDLEIVARDADANTLVDPAQLENALLNLAINARDAMDGQGRLTVEIGTEALGNRLGVDDVLPGRYVVLAVTDTGCGMTPEVIEQAFDPFFTTKPEGRGTGLGLSQVYGFVRQSGGYVTIDSEVGRGTKIRLYLPMSEAPEEILPEIEPAPASRGTETVLVVEDDESVRQTAVEMLTDLGYTVLEAEDGQSALEILESGAEIDLIFTDVVMPGPVRSVDLADRARTILPGVAVLFTSGYTRHAIDHEGRLDPGVDLLSKPYPREELARKVREVLDRTPPRVGSREMPACGDAKDGGSDALRVLLVEDDVLIRMATADMLADLGHEVVEAGSAAEALATLERQPIDVLLTDIGLPDRSGLELAREACGQSRDLRVVFASGHEVCPEEVGEEVAPRMAVLRKPYDETGLRLALSPAQ
ncbi:Multi-sensor hybrid histidine kinase [Lutibaculum baratangense AMV1]|uniref:histidine kinase n=1 Tax=Lutibaculum baratangense AMV1 TaxID=631454 RepID=V4RNY9_9HYPH|nr:Multi-sensor hybrid histidine kinase [Lutibaculum baratangense AMV1]